MIYIFEKLGEPGRWCLFLAVEVSLHQLLTEKTGSMYYFKCKFLRQQKLQRKLETATGKKLPGDFGGAQHLLDECKKSTKKWLRPFCHHEIPTQ
jgi:hypothetical protein